MLDTGTRASYRGHEVNEELHGNRRNEGTSVGLVTDEAAARGASPSTEFF